MFESIIFTISIVALMTLGFLIVGTRQAVYAVSDSVTFDLTVIGCDNDGSCEAEQGETNLNCPADCSGGGDTSDPPAAFTVSNIASSVSTSTATITWNTNYSATAALSWGLDTDYGLGTIVTTVPETSHSIVLTGLTPGTKYYFKIVATRSGNNSTVTVTDQTFTTTAIVVDAPPANPVPFNATYNSVSGNIDLSWTNPSDLDFNKVRVVRSTTFFPTDPNDGLIIYEGTAESYVDTAVNEDTTYYYTIFAQDTALQYSSGAVDDATVPAPEDPDDPDEDPDDPDDTEDPDDGGPPDEGPFEGLPVATTTPPIVLGDLVFRMIQGESAVKFRSGDILSLDAEGNFEITADYDLFPEVLKTIGVTLRHPYDVDKVFSFLLRVDENKTQYAANIAPLLDAGIYDMSINFIDHKNQRIERFDNILNVTASVPRIDSSIGSIARTAAPVGVLVGIGSGVVNTIALTSNITSLYDVYLFVVRLVGGLFGLLGIRRKRKPWGTVYDSITKRPLDPAYVVIKGGEEEKGSAITDLDGRYGFFLPGGEYVIEANKTNYAFPSKKLEGKTHDELYDNLYFGETMTTADGEVIVRNIPLDPVGFDWNEFAKQKMHLFRLNNKKSRIRNVVLDGVYVLGFVLSVLAVIYSPTTFNVIIVSSYLLVGIGQTLWRFRHKAASITNEETGEPYSFAIVRLFLSNLNQEVKKVVTDAFGKMYVLVAPGEYYYTVDAKQLDGSYKRVHTSEVMDLNNGVLKGRIKISEND